MATIPQSVTSPTVDAIYRAYEARREPQRPHLLRRGAPAA